jgi:exopolysaccharide biosynthesis WecB/TagA/CpsF family protein
MPGKADSGQSRLLVGQVAMVIDGLHLSSRMISGVAVCCGPPTDCVAAIDESVGRGSVRLGFVNTFAAYLLGKSDHLQSVLRDFVLLNDGIGLDLVSLIKYGERFGFNLNGTDFTPFYLKATRHKYRIYLLGGRPGIAERAAVALKRIAPQHDYVGEHHGYFAEAENAEIVADINARRADLVLVALGNPQQEIWIADNIDKTAARLAIGVGALFDFLADAIPRAPLWMRRGKLEWLYRLSLEPKRLWKRYMVFTPALIMQALAEKSRLS